MEVKKYIDGCFSKYFKNHKYENVLAIY